MRLPPCVQRLLWDVGQDVSWESHRDFLIERALVHGDWDAQQWVRHQAGDAAVQTVLERTRARSLSRAQIRFWQLILALPDELVDPWLDDPSRKVWDRRTA